MNTTHATNRRSLAEANAAANRRPENRRVYAEQQVAWFYADLLKAQHGMWHGPDHQFSHHKQRTGKAARDLAEAHASLDALLGLEVA